MNLFKKLLPDVVVIVLFALISFAYFYPAVNEGRILAQHDAVAGIGSGREMSEYLEKTGGTYALDKLHFWRNAYLPDVSEL